MRVLYFTQYFPPEIGATQDRAYEMARHLAQAGHEVTVVAEVPNHPSGIIPPAYRGRLFFRERMDGFEVVRTWVKAAPLKDFRNRLKFYLSYAGMATLAGLGLARGQYDVVFATSPPLFVGAAGLAVAAARRIPFVFEVRDLWPESATQLGFLRNPTVLRTARWFEETFYSKARRIVVVTEGIRRRLIERGIPEDKLALVRNGASPRILHTPPLPKNEAKARLGLAGKFVVLYAGIHGVGQGMENLIATAALMREDAGVHFVFVGEGPRKVAVQNQVAQLRLPNVTLLPERPLEEVRALYDAADAVLVPLKDRPLFRSAVPTKLFDAWACARPVVLSVEGEARAIMDQVRGGVAAKPESPAAIADAIRELKAHPQAAAAMGRRGHAAVLERFSREILAQQLEQLLADVVRRR